MTDIPHFKFPFSLTPAGDRTQMTEQDTDEEIMDCLQVLLSTVQGERIDLPEYGVQDQTFRQNGVDVGHVLQQIRRFEERADTVLETEPIEDLVQRINVRYRGGLGG